MFELIYNSEFIFEIRGVFSFNTCLEGGNLVKLTMHTP
jgi:hypothetical protein